MNASEKLRASYRQGKREREEDSDPDWSDDKDGSLSSNPPSVVTGHDGK